MSDDRPKLTFSELDRLRKEKGDGPGSGRPRGARAEAQVKQATESYLKEADKLFSEAKGGAAGEELAKAVRDAHGTPALTEACQAFQAALGMPGDPALLSLFLDADDPAVVAEAIRSLGAGLDAGTFEVSRGVKSQLRVLESSSDDDVAYEAEELLARL